MAAKKQTATEAGKAEAVKVQAGETAAVNAEGGFPIADYEAIETGYVEQLMDRLQYYGIEYSKYYPAPDRFVLVKKGDAERVHQIIAELEETPGIGVSTKVVATLSPESIIEACKHLSLEDLEQVAAAIDELAVTAKQKLIAQLEEQLAMLKAGRDSKRVVVPIVNPDNPNEVYTFGRTPEWLVAHCVKTGKTVTELRATV